VIVLWLATASLAGAQCVGDCDGDGTVSISDLVKGVQMALAQSASACAAMDMDSDGRIAIAELIAAVRAALTGCSASTQTPTPTTSPNGFRICGKAGERPVPDPPLARGVIVTLNPLGQMDASSSSGIFCFEDVPPGEYTVSVIEYEGAPSHCTEYGCWQDTPVTVTDADVLNVFVVMLPLPTPTPT
jgi:hypothetical protein